MFQKKFFVPLTTLTCFVIPTYIPIAYFGETFYTAWNITLLRYILTLHATWLVNSAAHIWGFRPYDSSINPAENKLVSIITPGEGWHNFHHIFPFDYKAAELGDYKHNFSTAFIDFFAWLGWAYELKTVPERVILARIARTGDGTHPSVAKKSKLDKNSNITATTSTGGHHSHDLSTSWGWDDVDTPESVKQVTIIYNAKKSTT